MELHQLRCFVAAAEQLHFGRAAQQLQMLPSALGRHVRLLEEDLGTRLFARTTRAVSLTDDGATLLREARPILARIESVESSFRDRSRAGLAAPLRDRRRRAPAPRDRHRPLLGHPHRLDR